jgi:Zn finger protein HypA/HybF involved in hydrogenase expression
MLAETLTITTETTNAQGAQFEITTFELEMTAFCDCCSNSDSGARTQLEARGWTFGKGCEFCGECS